MNKRGRYKFTEFLDEVFVNERSNFDPDITDSLSNLSEQVSETGRQESVNVSFFVFHRLLKDGN